MKKIPVWLMVAHTLALTACVTLPQQQWYRSGATPQQFYQELGNCQSFAFASIPDVQRGARDETPLSTNPRDFIASVGSGLGRQLGSIPGGISDSQARNQIITQCMYQQGWVLR